MKDSDLPKTSRKAVGIDLGTTFSAIAHVDAYGKPQIIPNAESERITPSVLLFDGQNAIVGTLAKQNSVAEPEKIPPDFGVVPLGMPLIAGPALITTLLLLAQTLGVMIALAALVANLGLVVLAFTYSERLGRLIGATGLRAISKIVAMLLAAIAVNMIRRGLSS